MDFRTPNLLTPSVFLLICVILAAVSTTNGNEEKVCLGTSKGLQHLMAYTYSFYKRRYTGCTKIDGNLEITYLVNQNKPDFNMSFLSSIEEVTGYVLIGYSSFNVMPLTNLKIIRGEGQLLLDKYSLCVTGMYQSHGFNVGLKQLQLGNLREISRGKVLIATTPYLCFVDTIDWAKITRGQVNVNTRVQNITAYCPPCDNKVCSNCWALSEENCQAGITLSCHASCRNGCFAQGSDGCCHRECAAGCLGPSNSRCRYCRHQKNDDSCLNLCPPDKYTFERQCLQKCPDFMAVEGMNCVNMCPVGKNEVDGECRDCGENCKTRCLGLQRGKFLTSRNINQFKGCQIVDGSILITKETFLGEDTTYQKVPPVTQEQLQYLSSVQEITGSLRVGFDFRASRSTSFPVDDLSFFENLRVIRGRFKGEVSLSVINTPFHSLGLNSLRKVYGKASFFFNPNLNIDEGVWNNVDWPPTAVEPTKYGQLEANVQLPDVD